MDKFIRKLNFDFITNQRILQFIGYIDGFKGLKYDKRATNAQYSARQYGGTTSIFSAFCPLFGCISNRRIKPDNRINNEHLVINLAAVAADEPRISVTSPAVLVNLVGKDFQT